KRRTIGDDRGARVLQEADLPEGGARGSLGRWRRGSLQDRVRLVGRRLQIGAGTPSTFQSSSGWTTPAHQLLLTHHNRLSGPMGLIRQSKYLFRLKEA